MAALNVDDPARPAVTNQPRLPRTAALGPGRGGQQRLPIDIPAGATEIYLHSATVTFWMPRGGSEVVFISRQAIFDGATAIRGGIPLYLSRSRIGINGDIIPKHGWTCIAPWRLLIVISTNDGGVRALLSVSCDHPTTLYEVEVDQTLRLGLSLRDEGSEPRTMEAVARTYLSVYDTTASRINGLASTPYSDNLTRSPQEAHHTQEGSVTVRDPVGRIYGSAELITVTDSGYRHAIGIDEHNMPSTIMWDP